MFLILRRPQSGRLEGSTALMQPITNSFTCSFAGVTITLRNASIHSFRISGSRLAQALADDAGDRVQHVFEDRAAAELDVADDAHAGPQGEAFRQVAEFARGQLDAGAVVGRALPRLLLELGRGPLLAG